MESSKMIKVKNLSKGGVTYLLENRHIRREWNTKNQIRPIPADELQEALYDQGIRNLFVLGYLGIESKEDRVLVGLDYEDEEETVEPFDENKAKILLLAEKNMDTFKERLQKMHAGEIETLIDTANTLKNVDFNKQKIIKEVLGVDISKQLINNVDNA
jgi:vacuolar-type H+-ATPase subunit F/Vma7